MSRARRSNRRVVRCIAGRSVTVFQLDRPRRRQTKRTLPGVHARNGAGAAGKIGAVCIAELEPKSLCTAQTIAPACRKLIHQLLVGGTKPALPYRRLDRETFDDIGGRFAVLAVLLRIRLSLQRLRPK